MKIKGTITYVALGPGFWGIVGDDGKEYRPVNLPAKYQKEGLKVALEARPASEDMSVFMWGKAVRIVE
ncbi:MAG: hypothetical protein D6714_03650 [Bacteroidetes bacterium]|nr:MAG: hypothetical protein D6714_03650 [Bacteroidota bacterium]